MKKIRPDRACTCGRRLHLRGGRDKLLSEREAALEMLGRQRGRHRATVGADKAYDTADFVAGLREMKVTLHVAQNTRGRRSAIVGRTTRHPGYATSQQIRKRIEEGFGWMKGCGGMRKTRHRGRARVGRTALMALAHDLPAAWAAPTTDARTKQRLARLLVREVIISLDAATNEAVVIVHWIGGRHTELRVARVRTGRTPADRAPSPVEVMRTLGGQWPDRER